jgi:hypothetical protein
LLYNHYSVTQKYLYSTQGGDTMPAVLIIVPVVCCIVKAIAQR